MGFWTRWVLCLSTFLCGAMAHAGQLDVQVTGLGAVNSVGESQINIVGCREATGVCSDSATSPTTLLLQATPDNGQEFTGWGGGCANSGLSPQCSIFVDEADVSPPILVTVTASFAPSQRSVNVSISGNGSVTGSGISCPEGCVSLVPDGSAISLLAIPDPGAVFVNWQGSACSGSTSATCTTVVTTDQDISVIFADAPDSDNDGVPDGTDQCPNTPTGEAVDAQGCSDSQKDDDGDGVSNDVDQCPSTPAGEAVDVQGCSDSQKDDDGDGVSNDVDQCPSTPAGEAVDAQGCSDSQKDDDGDGVSNDVDQCPDTSPGSAVNEVGCPPPPPPNFSQDDDGDGVPNLIDQCPDTPAGDEVDEVGCSLPTVGEDDDGDGVNNDIDQCPDTPPGDVVDAVGCSVTEANDGDGDGVADDIDQCPNTPPGDEVDEVGCSLPKDDDGDGVNNDLDQCPNTPPGDEVDEVGCSLPKDDDGDGVNNDLDQCPDTSPGEEVDEEGCSLPKDDDNDGVPNDADQCPATPPATPVDEFGCSGQQNFGNDLGEIQGLSSSEQRLGARVDEICPLLLELELKRDLTSGQRDLLDACARLKNRNTTEDQAVLALGAITMKELASMLDYAVELSNGQHRHLGSRLRDVAQGGGRGVSVSGLNLRSGDQSVPGHVLQSAFEGLLGMAAGEEGFADFGKLGLFLQGDINVGDKDESELESGYDFDAWSVTFGGDYRITDTVFAGLSASFGEVEVDYDGLGGQTDIENWSVAAYGGWQITDAWYLDGLLNYGSADYDFSRRIDYVDVGGSFESSHASSTDGDQVFLGLNTGYIWNPGSWRVGPIASLTYLDGSIDGFQERASGGSSTAWDYIVEDRDYESLRLHLGLQADYIWNTSFGVLIPGIRLAWVNETEDGPEKVNMRLVNNPFAEDELQSDNVSVLTEGRDSSFFDASFNLSGQFQMGFSGFVSYQFYSAYDDFSKEGFTLGLRWDKPY